VLHKIMDKRQNRMREFIKENVGLSRLGIPMGITPWMTPARIVVPLVPPTSRPSYLTSHLSLILPTSRPSYLSSYLPLVPPISRPTYLSSHLSLVLPTSRPTYLSSYLPLVLPTSKPSSKWTTPSESPSKVRYQMPR
jgi:hypothetical protein